MHHNKFQPECKFEKDSLIELIDKFKNGIQSVTKSFNLNLKDIVKMEEYDKLRVEFDDASQKMFDKEYFFSILGENFELNSKVV